MKKSKLNQKEEQFKIKIGPFTGPIIFCLAYLPALFIGVRKEVNAMRLSASTKERIRLRYLAGYSVWQIAEEFNITEADVTRIIGI